MKLSILSSRPERPLDFARAKSRDHDIRLYDIQGGRPSLAYSLGNIKLGDGVRFAGRGLVPLVGRKNYARVSALVSCPRFGVDLAKDPDAALQLGIAVAILFEGMLDPCTNFGGLANPLKIDAQSGPDEAPKKFAAEP